MLEPVVTSFPVDILTAHYRVYGEFTPRGSPFFHLNNADVETLVIRNATMTPLRRGMRLGPTSTDEMYIPLDEPQIVTIGDFRSQTGVLPKRARLMCFTDTYILQGYFHMTTETEMKNVFRSGQGPYFTATMVDIRALYTLGIDVQASAQICYVRGDSVRAFYPQAQTGEYLRATRQPTIVNPPVINDNH